MLNGDRKQRQHIHLVQAQCCRRLHHANRRNSWSVNGNRARVHALRGNRCPALRHMCVQVIVEVLRVDVSAGEIKHDTVSISQNSVLRNTPISVHPRKRHYESGSVVRTKRTPLFPPIFLDASMQIWVHRTVLQGKLGHRTSSVQDVIGVLFFHPRERWSTIA